MKGQSIENIAVKDLVLWTENPRDPIDPDSRDEDILEKAIIDVDGHWQLAKLVQQMGDYYMLSDLPTVVYKDDKPVVYDGNRRMILAKLRLGYLKHDTIDTDVLPFVDSIIACNVCSEAVALKNIEQKHLNSGSWSSLQRDYFHHIHLNRERTTFLKFEQATNLISQHSKSLDQGFVKKEIITESKLKQIGFEFEGNQLKSIHSEEEANQILNSLVDLIVSKRITTRGPLRGKPYDALSDELKDTIDKNKGKAYQGFKYESQQGDVHPPKKPRQTRKVRSKKPTFLANELVLVPGALNNLAIDIKDLYAHWYTNKDQYSEEFPSIIRMSLRLLSEKCASDNNMRLNDLINTHFDNAKKKLSADEKTTLHAQSVTKSTIVSLLQIGAHGGSYTQANNIDQAIAISLIIGQILMLSHGK
ncbi:hypothetical protein [Phaeocystidibacter marisrubri]|uniref:Uncharacterized protein n=1 Tax=Phaeocystidibacter marisrubri TaxID=1577780 RepID=A0A6L3ZH66_9FLAO|nr:hypothetical protein [Phaeocystidibacter marisrubri]KAB2816825.1 hypothetical protein F8C82_00050 [Phaeocystidibacter marisrubri]GGH77989.1 hypothetical protein GCM10011318_28590 [Phaeocystidibacter marisrubri]